MKTRSKTSKQSGFTLLEIMISVVILGVLVSALSPLFIRGMDSMKAKRVTDDVLAINTAAKQWKGEDNTYTGISITVLTGVELLPTAWGTGTGINPLDGNYTATASDANLVITATGLGTGICDAARKRVLSGAVSASCATGTLTATFR